MANIKFSRSTFLVILYSLFIGTLYGQSLQDQAGIFSVNQAGLIKQKLEAIYKDTGSQIVVYSVTNLAGKSIFEYSIEIANQLAVGQQGINNGILIFIAPNARKLQIQSGFGMEWILTDQQTQVVVDTMIAHLKKSEGDYYMAVTRAISLITEKISAIDWKEHEIDIGQLNSKHFGKVIVFNYSNKTGSHPYKKPIATDSQFDPGFKIKPYTDKEVTLYYSKTMNELLVKLLNSKTCKVFARVRSIDKMELELLGVLN